MRDKTVPTIYVHVNSEKNYFHNSSHTGLVTPSSMKSDWHVVVGYGAHIKATHHSLIIQQKGKEHVILLNNINHLLILGGHTLQTTAISSLIHAGISITLFKSDGNPIAIIRPYHTTIDLYIQEIQKNTPPFTYAVILAEHIIKTRILAIEAWNDVSEKNLLYAGELDILHQSLNEIPYLVTMDEIRRIERLVTDMYYEIMSRLLLNTPYNFKRRTERPYSDLINTMFGFGYAILTGLCNVHLIGAFLDLDYPILTKGRWGLAYDFAGLNKVAMIDKIILAMSLDGIESYDYELSKNRCILSDNLIRRLLKEIHTSIDQTILSAQVAEYIASLQGEKEWKIQSSVFNQKIS